MGELLFSGFVAKGIDAVADLETLLFQMEAACQKTAQARYAALLQEQCERIVDEIVLGFFNDPQGQSILNIAAGEVQRRMEFARTNFQDTEFNLYAGAQILRAPVDGVPSTLIRVVEGGTVYTKKLKKIAELIPIQIREETIEKKGRYEETWNAISDKYRDQVPITSELVNFTTLSCDPAHFDFKSPAQRAQVLAKEQVLNELLSSYACNGEIAPYKLMEYTGCCYARLHDASVQERISIKAENLKTILPNITFALISMKRGMPQSSPAQNEQEETDSSAECPEENEAKQDLPSDPEGNSDPEEKQDAKT